MQGVGLFERLIGGGNWNNSGYAGPSARNGNNLALNTNTNVSALGWIRIESGLNSGLGLYDGWTHILSARKNTQLKSPLLVG